MTTEFLTAEAHEGLVRLKARFAESHPTSQRLFERASGVLAGGVSHNFRNTWPFPLYWTRGQGATIWDVDDLPYVDYYLSGCAAIVGHGHPALVEALRAFDPHLGTAQNHELEIIWGERIKALYPAADLVRFTGSGSDSTTLAFRLVRAYTRKDRILRFEHAYHGWHDHAAIGNVAPFDNTPPGIPAAEARLVVTAPLDDGLVRAREMLEAGDVAGVILEPSGAGQGVVPLDHETVIAVRLLASEFGVPFICDENVTGFRWAPGGIQEQLDLDPDLTLLGKIATGGFPGGVVAGKAPIMDQIAGGIGSPVGHSGTYNGHPATAVAGIAMIDTVADGSVQRKASEFAKELQAALNAVIAELGVVGFAYGPESTQRVYLQAGGGSVVDVEPGQPDFARITPALLAGMPLELTEALHCGLCQKGVLNSIYNGGFTSSAHGAAELATTVEAYRTVLSELRELRVVACA